MAQPALSAAVRSNLASLQSSANLLGRTQERLATGLKVNSALDNPGAFFTAKTLEGRSQDLSTLLESQGQAIQTLKAADKGLEAIEGLLQTAKAIVNRASASTVDADREALRAEYETVLRQIETVATDSSYNGKNLIGNLTGANTVVGPETVTVNFNEDASSNLAIVGVDFNDTTAAGPGLAITARTTAGDFSIANDANITAAGTGTLAQLDAALSTVRNAASAFGTSLTIVEARQNFTKDLISTLDEGAGKLTLADTNEESANLLALQTRQQLGITALSLSAQADQSVLRLF